jgi:hypothetical protein
MTPTLTDDQFALVGCVVALIVSGTLMSLSYYLGRALRGQGDRTVDLPGTIRLQSPAPGVRTAARETDRKVA